VSSAIRIENIIVIGRLLRAALEPETKVLR
jgi:hypothetical protein